MAKCKECGEQYKASFWDSTRICPKCAGEQGQEEAPFLKLLTEATPRCFITQTILGLNVLAFVAMIVSGVSFLDPTIPQLLVWGADYGPMTVNQEWWRLLSSTFIHIGVLHLALNMWCLWNLGSLAERLFGNWPYLMLYVLCGLGGAVASLWWNPLNVSAGASGAIFGLAGALIAFFSLGKLQIPASVIKRNLKNVLTFVAYNVLYGLKGNGIDNAAHLGGLATGFVLGAFLLRPLPSASRNPRLKDYLVLIGAMVCIVSGALYVRGQLASGRLKPDFAAAMFQLGALYDSGEGVPKSEQAVLKWYRLAAEHGSPEAQFTLGVVYTGGKGVPKNEGEALKWYRLAAAQGLPQGQVNLGFMYANGQGVPKDEGEALRWYRLAAQQGFHTGQFNLGLMYANGQGVPKDNREALKWYRLAAEQGDAAAQYLLGATYAEGEGIPQDLVQAYLWLGLASKQGSEDATKLRELVAKEMTAPQILQAEALASNWKPKKTIQGGK